MDAPTSVAQVMDGMGVWWAVAGGWAIDLWLGAQRRDHHDVEVVVRRCDQPLVYAALAPEWQLFALDPPGDGWKPWSGTPIEQPAFQLQARRSGTEFDLFTETVDGVRWHFRRDHRIAFDLAEVVVTGVSGIPVVRPEIQLLYMAKSNDAKNEHDFQAARAHLTDEAAHWLANALELTVPGHRWLPQLRGA